MKETYRAVKKTEKILSPTEYRSFRFEWTGGKLKAWHCQKFDELIFEMDAGIRICYNNWWIVFSSLFCWSDRGSVGL